MANKAAHRLTRMAAADAALAGNLAVVSTSAGVLQTSGFDVLMGALARLKGVHVITDPYYAGDAARTGAASCHAAVQDFLDNAPAGSTLVFPFLSASDFYRWSAGVAVTKKSMKFLGVGMPFDQNGIQFFGTGPAIELDIQAGQAYDSGTYDGKAGGFSFEGMYLRPGDPVTPLGSGLGNYKAGTYGIRDWRGGSLRLVRADIRQWEYGIWGVQSDVNFMQDMKIAYNKTGAYLGPKSDQACIDHIWSFGNDTVWHLDGCRQMLISGWKSDTDGSASTCPVVIRSGQYTDPNIFGDIVFDTPWLESRGSFGDANPGFDVEAFFDVSTGDANRGGSVEIRSPFVYVYDSTDATKRHVKHLVKADRCASVNVDGIAGQANTHPWSNLSSVFKIVNTSGTTTPPNLVFRDADLVNGGLVRNETPNSVFVQVFSDGFRTYTNTNTGGGSVQMGTLGLHRAFKDASAAPSTGTTQQGDWTRNRLWDPGEAIAWVSAGGSPGTQYPLLLPTVSSDRGNADVTLTPGTDHVVQRFATTLTANRTVTLSTTGAVNGHRFKIVRTGLGAFTLDVGGLKTIPSATAAVVEVMYDGSAWRLVSYGAL